MDGWMDGWMDGFPCDHILILMINCYQKAASARDVIFFWICVPAKIEMVYSYKAYYV